MVSSHSNYKYSGLVMCVARNGTVCTIRAPTRTHTHWHWHTDTQARTHGGACNDIPTRRNKSQTRAFRMAYWQWFNNHTRSCTKPRLSGRVSYAKSVDIRCATERDDPMVHHSRSHSVFAGVAYVSLWWHSGALRSLAHNEILIYIQLPSATECLYVCLPERETATESRGKSVYTNTTIV